MQFSVIQRRLIAFEGVRIWVQTKINENASGPQQEGTIGFQIRNMMEMLVTPASSLAIALRIFFNHFLKTEHITKGRILPQSICSSKVRWAWDFLRLISSREPRASGWIMIHCWWIEVTKLCRSLPAPQRNMHSNKNKFLFPQRTCCNVFVSTCSKLPQIKWILDKQK